MKHILLAIAWLGFCLYAGAQGNVYVGSPRGADIGYSPGPFLSHPTVSARYQEIHDRRDFINSGLYSSGAWVTRVYFLFGRGNIFDPVPSPIENIEIRMSTVSRSPSSLDPVFANNVGQNDTIVFSGRLDWFEAPLPSDYPGVLGASIILQQPFYYRPTDGNLLIDVRNFAGGEWSGGPGFAFGTLSSTPESSIASAMILDVNANQASYVSANGFAIRFQMNAIPEPSCYALTCVGIIIICISRRSLNNRITPQ